jgi:DNA polymerase elongation subunit (family B)
MFLYLDIETIPTQSPEIRESIAQNIMPPARMSKAETIAQWEVNEKRKVVDEAIAKTALDGAYGSICCIGFAFDDWSVHSISMPSHSEAALLERFVLDVEDGVPDWATPTIVGHNVVGFDIRFIWQRAIILGVRMPKWFPRDPKPWGFETFDTMTAFAGQRGTIGLDRLCQVLGIEGKGDVDGSMIGQMYAEGRHEEIAAYCRADVERTRAVHKRMANVFGEAA